MLPVLIHKKKGVRDVCVDGWRIEWWWWDMDPRLTGYRCKQCRELEKMLSLHGDREDIIFEILQIHKWYVRGRKFQEESI